MSKLTRQLTTLARQGGGSFKTVADRSKLAARFAAKMAALNIQIRDVKHIKTHHIEKYIRSRQAEGISTRSLQNEMAAVRNILITAGRGKLADPQHEKLSNKALGLSQLLHIRLCDVSLEDRWIDLSSGGSKNHDEHRVPVVTALYPSLAYLLARAEEAGMEPEHQLFNVGWFDLRRKYKYPELMDEGPLRAFFRRLSRECNFTVTPHRFRHTVATHMMKSPERNLYVVKRLLGHVSLVSTLEYIDESVDGLRNILETELM